MKKKEIAKKNKKVKLNDKYVSDEASEVKRFVFILLGIIIAVIVVYGVSKVFIKEKTPTTDRNVQEGKINYDVVTVGTMLNKNEDEYYVIVYDSENSKAVLYSAIVNNYVSKEGSKNVYFCDLGNKINEKYYAGEKESNPNAKEIKDLAFKDLTLIKVKNGEIDKYIEGFDTIKSELKG